LAPPSELIIPVRLPRMSPGRNAASAPKIICTTTARAITATPASVNFLIHPIILSIDRTALL